MMLSLYFVLFAMFRRFVTHTFSFIMSLVFPIKCTHGTIGHVTYIGDVTLKIQENIKNFRNFS